MLDVGRRSQSVLILGGLVVIGLLARLPAMGMGIWTDETLTDAAVRMPDLAAVIARVVAQENNPPGYYVLLWPWTNLFGYGELALKVPSLVLGLLLIPATFVLGRLVAGREAGLVAAVMATLAGTSIYQSQEARPYALSALLACLAVTFYLVSLRGSRPWLWATLLALSGAALLYVQYTGGLLMAGLAFATVVNVWRGSRVVIPVLAAFVAIGLAFLPWLPTLLFHLRTAGGFTVDVSPLERPLLAIDNLGYGLPFPSSVLRSWAARGLVGFAVALLIVQALRPTGRAAIRSWAATMSPGGLTLVIVVGVVAVAEAVATYGERHMYFVSPLVWVLAGWAVVSLVRAARRTWPGRSRVVDALVGFGLAGWLLVAVGYAILLGTIPKSGIRTLVADERDLLAGSTLVVLAPDYLESAYEYYLPDGPAPHGLASWDFSVPLGGPLGWRDRWLAADARVTLDLISREATATSCLAFVYQFEPYDDVSLTYEKSGDLRDGLLATYRLVREADYPGRNEPAHLYVFALGDDPCGD